MIYEILKYVLLLVLIVGGIIFTAPNFKTQKIIPISVEKEVKFALSNFSELKDVNITFIMKKSLDKSFMKAQPNFWSLFRPIGKRKYHIYFNEVFELDGETLSIEEIPSKVLVGWFAHELGHIMDYKNRSSLNLIYFGLRYYFSSGFIKKAEKAADTYAIKNGMTHFLLATKQFILGNANLPQSYKQHIKNHYLSPDEIMLLAKEYDNLTTTTEK